MFRTDPERWARMFRGDVGFVRKHLRDAEAFADKSGAFGPEWTKAVRGRLWALHRQRWRDDTRDAEQRQRTAAKRAETRPKRKEALDLGTLIGQVQAGGRLLDSGAGDILRATTGRGTAQDRERKSKWSPLGQ
jgi:hypothetical protein